MRSNLYAIECAQISSDLTPGKGSAIREDIFLLALGPEEIGRPGEASLTKQVKNFNKVSKQVLKQKRKKGKKTKNTKKKIFTESAKTFSFQSALPRLIIAKTLIRTIKR